MRDDRERVRDMLDAIARIQKYADRGEPAFRSRDLPRLERLLRSLVEDADAGR